jgi:hypothetical protein
MFSRDKKADTRVVTTSNELQKALDSPHSTMVFVECVMDKYDAQYDLILGGHAIADTDYGVPGPQSAENAQILFPTRRRKCQPTASQKLVRAGKRDYEATPTSEGGDNHLLQPPNRKVCE